MLVGVAMTFGIFQEAYSHGGLVKGAANSFGVVGTTMNGVMYLTMPVLFTALDRGRWAKHRRWVAVSGVVISALAFLISSFSTQLWHLVVLQGVFAALGNTMVYSPAQLYLDEHFRSGRATAYGTVYSAKNIVGTTCPLIFSALLQRLEFRWTLRIWAIVVLATGALGIAIIPSMPSASRRIPQRVPWSFLRHRTFYIYSISNAVFSSGYGIPQTYLSSYARDTLHFSTISSALMITLFNAPGIISCIGFGLLSDKTRISSTANTFISAGGSCVCALLLWGLASNRIPAVLILFALTYGFFSSGYSSTWGGWIKDFEREAVESNEAINTGMLVGLFNGARGIGYVVSGVAGVELLNAGAIDSSNWGYGTKYGGLILFTGLSAVIGTWNVAFTGCRGAKRYLRAVG